MITKKARTPLSHKRQVQLLTTKANEFNAVARLMNGTTADVTLNAKMDTFNCICSNGLSSFVVIPFSMTLGLRRSPGGLAEPLLLPW